MDRAAVATAALLLGAVGALLAAPGVLLILASRRMLQLVVEEQP